MVRKRVLVALSLVSLGLAGIHLMRAAPADGDGSASAARRDIILIVTDDQAWHTLEFMPLTRALIGDRGVRFPNAFVTTPLCCPSRASIFTGLFSHNHGVLSNGAPLGGAGAFDDVSTIATWLRAAGYRTGLFGKYLNQHTRTYQPPGWSEWHEGAGYYDFTLVENGTFVAYDSTGSESYSVNVLADKVAEFIHSTPADRPFFAYFAPFAPHAKCLPKGCKPTFPQTDPRDLGSFDELAPRRVASYNEPDVSDKPQWVQDRPRLTATQQDSMDTFYRRQVESLQAVDRAVATIVRALEESGRLENTAIVYTSDNGFSLGEHRWTGKNCLYEECVRVPMLVRAPGVSPRTDERLVLNVDLAPTIAEWAGISAPGTVDGLSLARLLASPLASWRDAALLEVLGRSNTSTYHYANFQAVRTARYVYAEYMNGDRELYDLALDPHQLANAVADPAYRSVVAQLDRRLERLKQE